MSRANVGMTQKLDAKVANAVIGPGASAHAAVIAALAPVREEALVAGAARAVRATGQAWRRPRK